MACRRWLIAVVGVCVLGWSAVAGAGAGPLFFVVACDTQKPDNDPFEDFRKAVEQINVLHPDFTLMPGDLANNGTVNQYENFMKVARQFTMPVYYAIGNHDVNTKNLPVYWDNYCEYTGAKRWYAFERSGHKFIVLDSAKVAGGRLRHDGTIIPEQREWLRRQIASAPKGQPIQLVAHHPFDRDVRDGIDIQKELMAELAPANIIVTWAAHKHRNSYTVTAGPVHHFITGALSFPLGPNRKVEGLGYRLVSVNDGVIATAWARLDRGLPLVEVGKRIFAGPPHADAKGTKLAAKPATATTPIEFAITPEHAKAMRGGAVVHLRCLGVAAVAKDNTGHILCRIAPSTEWSSGMVPLTARHTARAAKAGVVRITLVPEQGARVWLASARLLASQCDWEVYATRNRAKGTPLPEWPTAPKPPSVGILYPEAGARITKPTPVIVHCGGVAEEQATLWVDGKPAGATLTPAKGWGAVFFVASGVQGKSYHFKNALFADGKMVSMLPTKRDVRGPEPLAYPLKLGAGARPAELMLTAGTKTDPSGANPPENNEDWVASSVVFFDGTRYFIDPEYPPQRSVVIGDNRPECSTRLVVRPTAELTRRSFGLRVLLLDPKALGEGTHTLSVLAESELGAVSATRKVIVGKD